MRLAKCTMQNNAIVARAPSRTSLRELTSALPRLPIAGSRDRFAARGKRRRHRRETRMEKNSRKRGKEWGLSCAQWRREGGTGVQALNSRTQISVKNGYYLRLRKIIKAVATICNILRL